MERGRRLILGSLAGIVATVGMTAFMVAARRVGWVREHAPEEVTERSVERATDQPARGPGLTILTSVAHVAFGGAAGAVYVVSVGRSRPASLAPGLVGALYGSAVWLGSYWGVLPSLGLMPSPPEDERGRPLVMLVAHWIYGALLGVLAPRPEAGRSR